MQKERNPSVSETTEFACNSIIIIIIIDIIISIQHKKMTFNHTNEWRMYKIESVLDKETQKTLGYFKIQTDPPGQKLFLID